MPVKSLSSSVKKWPDRLAVLASFESWAQHQMRMRTDITRIGCFGSIAGGTWGFGSDLDIIIILKDTAVPPMRRALEWDTTPLPVPADIVVLTEQETTNSASLRFKQVLENKTRWVTGE